MVQEFKDSDQVYFRWLDQHPSGYVINAQRNESPTNMVLHRATCKSIRKLKENAQEGGFTERDYIKICDVDLEAI